jgi:hypothetical protein
MKSLSNPMNDTLSEAIERLLKADADYRAFVRTTKSHQLAAEGAREAVRREPPSHASGEELRDFYFAQD